MSNNIIGYQATDSIAAVLSCNNKLQQLKLNSTTKYTFLKKMSEKLVQHTEYLKPSFLEALK